MKKLRAIDICAGAGGWAVAARGLPIKIVAAVDLDEDCMETYRANHPRVECVTGDVLEMSFKKWRGKIDLVLGGIPCELISTARNGIAPPAEHLRQFQKLVDRCLELPGYLRAEHWCFEDVEGLLPYLPLMTPYFTADSQVFSPQRRKRVYVGNLGLPLPPQRDTRTLDSCLLPGPYRRSMRLKGRTPRRSNVYNTEHFYPWMFGEKSPTVIGLQCRHDNYAAVENGLNEDGEQQWRQMEWQELALLQGFPMDYVFVGSQTRVSKMVAQAVQIDTGRAILTGLCLDLSRKAAAAGQAN